MPVTEQSLAPGAAGQGAGETLDDRFLDFLTTAGEAGRAAVHALLAAGRDDERLHTYNHSPLLTRPGLLSGPEVTRLGADLSTLLDVMVTLPERRYGGSRSAMCAAVGIDGPARQAVLDTPAELSPLLARADVVWSAGGPKAIELNIHSSLGGMDIGPLDETFAGLPVYGDFLRAERLTYADPLEAILGEVLRAARAAGVSGSPTLALVDWPTTYPVYAAVLERVCTLIRARGVEAVHCSLDTLERRGGRLWAAGREIDVVYRIFMLEDVPEQPALIEPLVETVRAGQVVLAMGFGAELVGNKASLALLSEVAGPDFLSADERACLDRLLPQTRPLSSATIVWDGERCDVARLAAARQRDLIVKPSVGHGTLGITAGWAVSAQEWSTAVRDAIGAPFVLQERVVARKERMPVLRSDGSGGEEWGLEEYAVNWGVFVQDGRYAGAMLRALPQSRASIISLGAGGAVGCCFHQEPDRGW